MPSATNDSFNDDLLNENILAFMNNSDQNGTTNIRGSLSAINLKGLPASTQKSFLLDSNGSFAISKVPSLVPLTQKSQTHQINCSGMTTIGSPEINNNFPQGVMNTFSPPSTGTKLLENYHSLQNSPFYNHYQLNMGFHPLRRQNSSSSSLVMSCTNNSISQKENFNINSISSDLPISPGRQAPQRELFPHSFSQYDPGLVNSIPPFNHCSGFVTPDRLQYYVSAQKHGFIVGPDLDRIKENSRRSTSHTYGRISAHFRNRYGETEAKTKASYMQLGVRVPSKDHVSEIVGKGGQKIKRIREETGALITTPGEYEDHVFIIEAPPNIALLVANHIATRAQEITQSKLSASERRRGSTSSISGSSMFGINNFSVNGSCATDCGQISNCNSSSFLNGNLCGSSEDPNCMSSPSSLLKGLSSPGGAILNSIVSGQNVNGLSILDTSTFNGSNGVSVCANGYTINDSMHMSMQNALTQGCSSNSGRVLLARSRISVPQDMVGKIIGTQGSIITTIQKDTGTEIKSPPKEAARGPAATSDFEISAYQSLGMTSNQAAECRVQQAKQLIGHLVMRQFERRASDDIDEPISSASSGGRKNSADTIDLPDQSKKPQNASISTSSSRAVWMWPDVIQMDSIEAREVLDRILTESKSKTRRAKELITSSVPPSPGGSVIPIGFNGGMDMFSEKNIISSSATTTAVPLSSRTSPFHQSSSLRGIPASYNQLQSSTQTTSLINGILHDQRLTENESGFAYSAAGDYSGATIEQQAFLRNKTTNPISTLAPSESLNTPNFWQNLSCNHPDSNNIQTELNLASHCRHSFSSGSKLEESPRNCSRRNTDFGLNGLDHINISNFPIEGNKQVCELNDWGLEMKKSSNASIDTSCCGSKNNNNNINLNSAFDFIRALDCLCLNSTDGGIEALPYPPGFDLNSRNSEHKTNRNGNSHWSVGNDINDQYISRGLFSNGGDISSDARSGSDFSDASVGDTLQASDAMRNIWSDIPSGENFRSNSGLFSGLQFPLSVVNSFSTNAVLNNKRCGAVGDGRRRSTPPDPGSIDFSPVSNSNGLNDNLTASSIPAV